MKQFLIDDIGTVKVYKRRGSRHIRISFDLDGTPRINLPAYASYRAGVSFAKQKRDWIISHRPPAPEALANNQLIAGKYQLVLRASTTASSSTARLKAARIIVTHPASLLANDPIVQAAARRGAMKALKLEAERILPPRLAELAKNHGYKYGDVKIKSMKRRWGSCDIQGNITLNLFLIRLEPELIDYVLLHELTHTTHPHHQPDFWAQMEMRLPNVKILRERARTARIGLY